MSNPEETRTTDHERELLSYIVNEAGERVSVVLSVDEYQALLNRSTSKDETDYLLSSPENARVLRERLQDIRQGKASERELLPDED